MRPFEILLVVIGFLALLLSFRNRTKAVWLGVAVVSLLGLLIHALAEGLRWQMAFSYILAVLLVPYALTRGSSKRSESRIRRAAKVIAIAVSSASLALTAFLAYALPVFTILRPTGNHAVGVNYFHLVDERRTDPFLDRSTQKRELMVKVYYPGRHDASKPPSRYLGGSARLTRALAAFYQMPGFIFDHLTLVRTHSKGDLEISEEQPRFPVILFSHGAGTTMEFQTSQSQDLASHGYIVVAIDHTFVSAATAFPGRIVTAREATTDFDTPEPAEPITQIMADDGAFVLNELAEMNQARKGSPFNARLDLDRIGVIGHSVGGATAYNMAINDRRVKAAINLDGTVYVTPKGSRDIAPFLMLANDKYHVQAVEKRESLMKKQNMRDMYGSKKEYDVQLNKAQRNIVGLAKVLRESGTLYTIEGSDHMKLTDIGLFIDSRWLRELLQISGRTDPEKCLAITQALTVAFFDQHLKGQPEDLLESLTARYPRLRKANLN